MNQESFNIYKLSERGDIVDNINQQAFYFSFRLLDKTIEEIFTFDRNTMLLFLTQHGFDIDIAHVQIYHNINEDISPCWDDIREHMLKPFVFQSNVSGEKFTIYTTDNLLTSILDDVGETLSDTSMFGSLSLRTEIEIFDDINKDIETLRFGTIMDHNIANGEYEYEEEHRGYYASLYSIESVYPINNTILDNLF